MLRLPQTLLGRLAGGVALVAAGMFAGQAWLLSWQMHSSVRALHALFLEAATANLTDRLARDGVAGLGDLPPGLASRYDPRQGGTLHFTVLDRQGRVLAASPARRLGLPRHDLLAEDSAAFRSSGEDSRLWGLSRSVPTPDGQVILQVAQDMRSVFVTLDDVPASVLGPMMLIFLAGALLLILLIVGLARLALQPLRRAAAEAATIAQPAGSGGRRRRLSGAGVPAEALPLIRAVNGALERLDSALDQQRTFSQDVAHELRTPLAVMLTEIDLLEDTAAAARLRQDIVGLSRLVDQLLDAAEAVATEPAPDATVELGELCRDMALRLRPLAEAAGCHLHVAAPQPVPVRGQAEALARALRNLVENAIAHAPLGSEVTLRTRAPGTLEVADRGPGVPPEQRGQVFERFWRADEGGGGKGLGLAIVAGIAASHGGTATVAENAGGGAIFALHLPAAAPEPEPEPAVAPARPALA